MQSQERIRAENARKALGIVSVEGKEPSALARRIAERYTTGEIDAAQAKIIYLKEKGLVP